MRQKTQSSLLSAIEHVVHDYANLVSSGTMVVAGRHRRQPLTPPMNAHIGEAFLLSCRKMDDFFTDNGNKKDDLFASDYSASPIKFDLPSWAIWRKAMNKQLMHVTLTRTQKWEGHIENKLFLAEFKRAWKLFLSKLPEPYKREFSQRIAERLKAPEYAHLDLM